MSLMDLGHVTICFDDAKEVDLALAWSYRSFIGINFKMYHWTPGFSTKIDPTFIFV